jgi:hypothetical protein
LDERAQSAEQAANAQWDFVRVVQERVATRTISPINILSDMRIERVTIWKNIL